MVKMTSDPVAEILTDFEQLCIEFQVWANARVQWTTSKDANELVEQWQEVQGIEEAQSEQRFVVQ